MTEQEIDYSDSWGTGGLGMCEEEVPVLGIMTVMGSKADSSESKRDFAGWIRFGKDPNKETNSDLKAVIKARAAEVKKDF